MVCWCHGQRSPEEVSSRFGSAQFSHCNIVTAKPDFRHGSAPASREILGGMRALPAHPEASDAIARLKQLGYRLATLTSSSSAMVHDQLRSSGLFDLFDTSISVDRVRCFKPARAVYEMAAAELDEDANNLWLVAAHNWDTTGALRAGWKAAFVQRPGMVLGPLDMTPQVYPKAPSSGEALSRDSSIDHESLHCRRLWEARAVHGAARAGSRL